MGVFFTKWTAEEDAVLIRLYKQQPVLTAAHIGKIMGKTRNAIIGRAHRLELHKQGFSRQILRVYTPRKVAPNATVLAKAVKEHFAGKAPKVQKSIRAYFDTNLPPQEVLASTARRRVPDLQLKLSKAGVEPPPEPARTPEGELFTPHNVSGALCRFPYNHPGEAGFHYCGQPGKSKSHPWCDFHRKIVYEPAREPLRVPRT